jgi:hypothetical protein
MKIDTNLRIGWVNSGGMENAPAWIQLPAKMPFYGSKAFREMTITMFLRRSFLDHVAIAIAHEFSHSSLFLTPWRRRGVASVASVRYFRLRARMATYSHRRHIREAVRPSNCHNDGAGAYRERRARRLEAQAIPTPPSRAGCGCARSVVERRSGHQDGSA